MCLLSVMLSSSSIAVTETAVFKTALVSVGVNVLFVRVSVASNSETVPVKLGKVIVRSALGSATTKVVSFASSVLFSKTIFVSKTEVFCFQSSDFCIHRFFIFYYIS